MKMKKTALTIKFMSKTNEISATAFHWDLGNSYISYTALVSKVY